QLLKLRPLAREHLIYQCGNGERFSLWFDPWVQGESVHALYGHRVIYDTGLGMMARVKDIIWEGEWAWPPVSGDLIELQLRMQGIPINSAPDRIYWDRVGAPFSTSKAWQGIRPGSSLVAWHRLVWHPKNIPKHAFCLWLTIRGAHRTRDKLVAMGVTQQSSCLFNCGEPETLDHLFFLCPFSSRVWLEVLGLCNIVRPILPWTEEVDWMITHAPGNTFHHSLRKLAMAATVYHLWIERNNRCFNN
ncbi:zf-RVT domain-containing protein, partial [Cephalotus follicularis]